MTFRIEMDSFVFEVFTRNSWIARNQKKKKYVRIKSTTSYRKISAHALSCTNTKYFSTLHIAIGCKSMLYDEFEWLCWSSLTMKTVRVYRTESENRMRFFSLFRFFFLNKHSKRHRDYIIICAAYARVPHTFLLSRFYFLFLFCFANVRNSCLSTILHTFVTRILLASHWPVVVRTACATTLFLNSQPENRINAPTHHKQYSLSLPVRISQIKCQMHVTQQFRQTTYLTNNKIKFKYKFRCFFLHSEISHIRKTWTVVFFFRRAYCATVDSVMSSAYVSPCHLYKVQNHADA